MKKIERIDGATFHRNGSENSGLTVVRLHDRHQNIERAAPNILEVMHATYTRLFTAPTKDRPIPPLTKEAVTRKFSPSRENIARQTDRMHGSIVNGAAYWLLKLGSYPNGEAIDGFIKTTPSKPGKLRYFVELPNCFVGDLATSREDLDDSRALMFVALSDFREDRKVALNAQEGNDTENAWLAESGFEDLGPIGSLEIAGEDLGQHRYEHVAVAGLRRALIAQAPWLANGLPHVPKDT